MIFLKLNIVISFVIIFLSHKILSPSESTSSSQSETNSDVDDFRLEYGKCLFQIAEN